MKPLLAIIIIAVTLPISAATLESKEDMELRRDHSGATDGAYAYFMNQVSLEKIKRVVADSCRFRMPEGCAAYGSKRSTRDIRKCRDLVIRDCSFTPTDL